MNPELPRGNQMQAMRALVLLGLVIGLAGCPDNPPANYPVNPPDFDMTKLVLGPGDKVELTIYYGGGKESKATYTLDSSGQLEVQYIGSVEAAGKDANQVKTEIQQRLADGYLVNPTVSVSVVERNSLHCSVFGQVAHSGTIKFTPHMTIVEAIAQSGGFAPLARKNFVQVTRTVGPRKETYQLPVEMIGEGKRPNFEMMPGDQVFVPERTF
ncbi:MAG TPA: polysaccharide biosynthesis/export family protein [Kofleriaceae bacterium]|jgi:polysaccharide export outer membrane protein